VVLVAWYLNRALTGFRNAVNKAYPRRDKTSDGTIGDAAHQSGSSDHNEDPDGSVDAWDMDVEVNGKGNAYAADVEALKRVFEAHPSSKYWIHNDRISFRSEGWKPRSYAYAGPKRNQHRQHVHFNTRESHEDSTALWNVQEDKMPLTNEEHNWLRDVNFTLGGAINNPTGAAGSVPFHVWAEWLTSTVKALAAVIAKDSDVDELLAKLEEIDADADARAVEAATRDQDLRALIEAHHSGELSADEVVDKLAARLSD
jgi:hypothetical protein